MSLVRATAAPSRTAAPVFNALLAYSGDKAAAAAAIRGELFEAAKQAAMSLNFNMLDATLARLLNTENKGSVSKAELAAYDGGAAIPADKATSKAYIMATTLRSIKAAARDFYDQNGGAAARNDKAAREAYNELAKAAASNFADQGMNALSAAADANAAVRKIKAEKRKLEKQEEAAKLAAEPAAPVEQAPITQAQQALFDAVALIDAIKAGDAQAIEQGKLIAAALKAATKKAA